MTRTTDAEASGSRLSSPLVNRAHQHIRDSILRGEYRPNERLIEAVLAQQLGVSRTPLREALARLHMEGLISGGQRGWTVRDFSAIEVSQILEVRAALESMAAYLVAQTADDATIESLAARHGSHDHMALAEERGEEFVDDNDRFHDALLEAAGSPRLMEFTRLNRDFFFNYRIARLYSEEEARNTILGHERIIEAIVSRDAERAAIEMRRHILEGRDVMISKLY